MINILLTLILGSETMAASILLQVLSSIEFLFIAFWGGKRIANATKIPERYGKKRQRSFNQ